MVTLHEVITFLVSMQISISSLQTHNVNRCFFFFNDTATPEIYTLPLHAALPIYARRAAPPGRTTPPRRPRPAAPGSPGPRPNPDRKSTRLNSSHLVISYAVFCLKKKIPPNEDITSW